MRSVQPGWPSAMQGVEAAGVAILLLLGTARGSPSLSLPFHILPQNCSFVMPKGN
jgi:hypothetical protein